MIGASASAAGQGPVGGQLSLAALSQGLRSRTPCVAHARCTKGRGTQEVHEREGREEGERKGTKERGERSSPESWVLGVFSRLNTIEHGTAHSPSTAREDRRGDAPARRPPPERRFF